MQSCNCSGPEDNTDPRKLCQASDINCCGLCTKLDRLNAQIVQAKSLLQNLSHQRNELRFQLNPAHPSMIDRMPAEVASHVFMFFATGKDSPLTLGAVCQTWRQIAWSAPSLWTSLTIKVLGSRVSKTRIQLAKEWLGRSGKLPLSIFLCCPLWKNPVIDLAGFYELINIINERCNQWYSLDMDLPSSLLARLNDSNCVSPILHTLSLTSAESPMNELTLHTNRVTPRTVKIDGHRLSPRSLNWNKVTHLTATLLYVDQILEILLLGPRLEECHLSHVGSRNLYSPAEAHRRVTNSRLKSLEITLLSSSISHFFGGITLPVLENLSVSSCSGRLPTEELLAFIERSASDLKSLSLDDMGLSSQEWIEIAISTPSLEHLSIGLYPGDEDELRTFYRALAGHFRTSNNPSPTLSEPLLPSLQTFKWLGDGAFPWEVIPDFLVPLSQDDDAPPRPLNLIQVYCNSNEEGGFIPYVPEVILGRLASFNQVEFQFEIHLDDGTGDLWQMSLKTISQGH